MSFLRKRLQDEKGFTLIELLVVVIILGILMAIAIPSYMKFKGKANDSAAQANVSAAIPLIEDFASDHADGYTSLTIAGLQASYDAGVKNVTVVAKDATTYCIESTAGSPTYKYEGPGGPIVEGSC